MATTGQVYAGSAESVSEAPWSDETWLNPTNATGAPNAGMTSITSANYDSGDQSFVLKAYNYGFSLPAGSTVVGVTVRVKAAREMAGAGAIGLVQLLSTTRAKVGDNKAATEVAITATGTEYTFGGSSDLWGNALTEAWVEDADFGVAIGFWARAANTDVEFDAVSIEITYTEPPTQTSVARVSLASLGGDPAARVDHAIKVRARVQSGAIAGNIRAALYEGSTNRSGDLESSPLSTTLTDYTLNISKANAEDITDYSNLEIRFWGYCPNGGAATFEVDQIWLELPDVAGAGATTVTLPRLDRTRSFFTPTVTRGAITVTLPQLVRTRQFFTHKVSLNVPLPQLVRSRVFFGFTVTRGAVTVTLPFHTRTRSFFTHTVTPGAVTVTLPLLTRTRSFFTMTITAGTTVTLPLLTRTRQFFTHTITTGAITVTLPQLVRTRSFFTHTVNRGAVTVTLPQLVRTRSFFNPTLTAGAITVTLPQLSRTRQFFTHVVTGQGSIALPQLVRTRSFFTHTVNRGAVIITLPRLDRSRQFYTHFIGTIEPPVTVPTYAHGFRGQDAPTQVVDP